MVMASRQGRKGGRFKNEIGGQRRVCMCMCVNRLIHSFLWEGTLRPSLSLSTLQQSSMETCLDRGHGWEEDCKLQIVILIFGLETTVQYS